MAGGMAGQPTLIGWGAYPATKTRVTYVHGEWRGGGGGAGCPAWIFDPILSPFSKCMRTARKSLKSLRCYSPCGRSNHVEYLFT
jgi:hypothetical protein